MPNDLGLVSSCLCPRVWDYKVHLCLVYVVLDGAHCFMKASQALYQLSYTPR